ncbi:4-hydroxy-tetrahydrodipicolinate synthase [Roseobacter fucihabitans]|uniref:4-hydroxy-tetrahydrodipicolinate synthase n=2 Tax=Roseobacter fucihabitans TaxID=1537242 RepID=A0ABZ2BR43_9RHOB|nr:4-hydroxy-tetrahydrodipicolinate synthase [Roseobacter litoralis]
MEGIVPSLNTPFAQDGSVDHASLRRLVDHTVAAGCGGMLGLAVAGEYAMLGFEEKTAMIETIAATNSDRIPFIVSVTAPDLAETLDLSSVARSAGARGVCVQVPAGFARHEALVFLNDVAARGPGLLMVQDLDWAGPGRTLEDIVFLHENIEAFSWLKIETSQAGVKYTAVLNATNGALNVCGGWAVTQLMDALARGVQAFIPTGMERIYVAIFRRFKSGDVAGARALFERVLPVLNFSNQHIDISIRFFKELRKAEGLFESGKCRQPGAVFDPVQESEAAIAMGRALVLAREIDMDVAGLSS